MATPYPQAEQAQRESQVPHAMDILEKAINEAEQSFASLVQRCESVQRAQQPEGTDKSAKISEALCPLADRIRRCSDRIFNMSYNTTGLMSRIEL